MFSPRPGIERLEARIAPAVFYVSGLKILDESGQVVSEGPTETLNRFFVGADRALLLHPGDTLYLHTGSRAPSPTTDAKLVEVTAGDAMVFFTNGKTGNVRAFERTELTGLAVSDGFQGAVYTDINGSVATVLDGNDDIGFSGSNSDHIIVQDSSIAGLHVAGQIAGSLLAGGKIEAVDVHGPLYLPHAAKISVGTVVATGLACTGQELSFNGRLLVQTQFTAADGENGPDIHDLTLTLGATTIVAGDGAANPNGAPGHGGSISGLHIARQMGPLNVAAGNGGSSANGGPGAGGGSITASDVGMAAPGKEVIFAGGRGADSTGAAGGDGGSLSGLAIQGAAHSLTLHAGAGGAGATGGGTGGSLLNLNVKSSGALDAAAGAGGAVPSGSGSGGSGGSVVGGFYALSPGAKGEVTISAGGGGDSFDGTGGQGGNIGALISASTNQTAINLLTARGSVSLHAGDAGAAGDGGIGDVFNGSAGGAISQVTVNAKAFGSIEIRGGRGAYGSAASATGGAGGDVQRLSVFTEGGGFSGTLDVDGGQNGNMAPAPGGNVEHVDLVLGTSSAGVSVVGGENGGRVDDLNLVNARNRGSIWVTGGSSFFGDSAGGSVSGVSIVNHTPGLSRIDITGGNSEVAGGSVSQISLTNFAAGLLHFGVSGGTGDIWNPNQLPAAGRGGAVQNVHVVNFGTIDDGLIEGGWGAPGGSVDEVTIDSTGTIGSAARPCAITGQVANYFSQARAHADLNGGDVSNLKLNAPKGFFSIQAGHGYDTNVAGESPGKGGAVSAISGTVAGVEIYGGNGGRSTTGIDDGGAGGDVSGVSLLTKMAREIGAGSGGEGKSGGAGGSVHNVTISGDIGDFTKPFGFLQSPPLVSMGGLAAGEGGVALGGGSDGTNGSIDNISAARIAAIVAGDDVQGGTLTYRNAVASISNVQAAVLGADTHLRGKLHEIGTNGGVFDYFNTKATHDTKFEPDSALDPLDGDVPIDGLVMVKKGGLTTPLPVTPLLLIEV